MAHASVETLSLKRRVPDSSCTHSQLTKRLRCQQSTFDRKQTPTDVLKCFHCGSSTHTWSVCDAVCLRCFGRHVRRRCPSLSLKCYAPGGFIVSGSTAGNDLAGSCLHASLVKAESPGTLDAILAPVPLPAGPFTMQAPIQRDGICPERVAMIAHAPAPANCAGLQIPVGPRRTLANTLPLGKANRLTSVRPVSGQSELSKTNPPLRSTLDEKVWSDLCQHIFNVVRGRQDKSKSVNNGSDSAAVDMVIRESLAMLKPMVLRAHQGG